MFYCSVSLTCPALTLRFSGSFLSSMCCCMTSDPQPTLKSPFSTRGRVKPAVPVIFFFYLLKLFLFVWWSRVSWHKPVSSSSARHEWFFAIQTDVIKEEINEHVRVRLFFSNMFYLSWGQNERITLEWLDAVSFQNCIGKEQECINLVKLHFAK